MARNIRNYVPREDKKYQENLKKLRSQVRTLQKQIKQLKSDNDTLLDAWAKTEAFLAEITDGVPLEDLLRYRNLPKKAIRTKDKKVEKIEINDTRAATRAKFREWREKNL